MKACIACGNTPVGSITKPVYQRPLIKDTYSALKVVCRTAASFRRKTKIAPLAAGYFHPANRYRPAFYSDPAKAKQITYQKKKKHGKSMLN
jgi:hypothetical protein